MFSYIINFKTVFSCFISAIGYSIGYYVPNSLGWPLWICIVLCLALGFVFDIIGEKLVNLPIFEGKPYRELIVGLIIYAIYLAAWFLIDHFLQHDLDYDLQDALLWMIGLQFLGWVINMIKQYIKQKKKAKKEDKKEDIKE